MNIYEKIISALLERYNSGQTYTDIAKEADMSYSYIHGLMNGKNPPQKLSLEKLFKLFPRATIDIHDNHVSVENVGIVAGDNNKLIAGQTAEASAEQIRARIIAALIPLDIQPDALQTVLRAINELDLEK